MASVRIARKPLPPGAPAYGEGMGVVGELFPQRKTQEDADAAADGQMFRIGPIDLESGVVQLRPTGATASDVKPDRDDESGA